MLPFSTLTSADAASTIRLRPYQETCVTQVLAAYRRCPCGGRALIVLPTGGGKTIVFTEIARRLGLGTLIIAHRQELLQQATDKYLLVDPTAIIGQVGAGRHEYGAPITVASVQTISRPDHLKALKRFGYGLVIVDEAHHAPSAGYQAVLAALPEAFVLGVTATPDRLDGKSIERIFGRPVFSASIIDMVKQGYLCDVRAIAVRTDTSLDDLHTHDGDFQLDELEEVIDTPERNTRIAKAYIEHAHGRQAICFGVTVEHARHLAEAFNKAHVRAAVVSGETPPEERKRLLLDYELGILEVVCNVGVLTEGYDAPQTSCIIMARPTRSRALYVQCAGRGLRLAPGKDDCVILDITDNCLKHRLEPQTLGKAFGKELRDGESLRASGKWTRTESEEEAGSQERKTKVTRRAEDLTINVLARMDWKRLRTGAYILEVGEHKHNITLVPSRVTEGYYSVWARLAPDFQEQQWLKDSPLDWAQQHAEMKARVLEGNEKKRILVDSTAPWRARPATQRQIFMLRQFKIDFTDTITSGEASDLIGRAMAERDRLRAEKKATAAPRTKATSSRKKARASA